MLCLYTWGRYGSKDSTHSVTPPASPVPATRQIIDHSSRMKFWRIEGGVWCLNGEMQSMGWFPTMRTISQPTKPPINQVVIKWFSDQHGTRQGCYFIMSINTLHCHTVPRRQGIQLCERASQKHGEKYNYGVSSAGHKRSSVGKIGDHIHKG
jgi:hypothetical protein